MLNLEHFYSFVSLEDFILSGCPLKKTSYLLTVSYLSLDQYFLMLKFTFYIFRVEVRAVMLYILLTEV